MATETLNHEISTSEDAECPIVERLVKSPTPELLKEVATEFFYWWPNQPGTNTQQGFDDWWEMNHERFGF